MRILFDALLFLYTTIWRNVRPNVRLACTQSSVLCIESGIEYCVSCIVYCVLCIMYKVLGHTCITHWETLALCIVYWVLRLRY